MINLGRTGCDLGCGKVLHGLAQHIEGFPQCEVQAGEAGNHLGVGGVHKVEFPVRGTWNRTPEPTPAVGQGLSTHRTCPF